MILGLIFLILFATLRVKSGLSTENKISGLNEIILSAHHLAEKIDLGRTICTLSYPVNYDISKTLEENIQRLRDEITPLFSDIVKNTIIKYLKK